MVKTRAHLFALSSLLALTFSLSSCKSKEKSEDKKPVDPIITDNDYFNEKNFIESSKELETQKLVTYEGPSLLNSSSKVSVKVEDKDLFVYETRVNHATMFSWNNPETTSPYVIFDFEGKVHVEITVLENLELSSAIVRPLVYGIAPKIVGKTISFDLDYTADYVVEYNNDPNTAVHLFTNPIETDAMDPNDANGVDKIYIGPGVYNAGTLPLCDNCEIYLAGGAYVYGQISGESFNNIKIYGRGIISGSIFNRRSESEYTLPIKLRFANNIEINDIAIVDPAGWAITLYDCTNVKVNNIKIFTARQNGDGISVQSCHDVEVHGGFVRTWDDSLVVKNEDKLSTSGILFDGVTVWTDLAQSMEVGYETWGDTMTDITFQNITVLHNFHKALISMHNSDNANISNVTYKNITLEDGQMLGDVRDDNENDFLIDFTIAFNPDWTKSGGERGSISNIKIENVNVYNLLDSIGCRFQGESANSSINNVNISGVKIEGRMMSSLSDLKATTNTYTNNISVSTNEEVLGAYVNLPYKNELTTDVVKNSIPNISQEGMLVPDFAYQQGGLPYIGVKSMVTTTNAATHGAGTKTTTPVDDGTSANYSLNGTSPANVTDGDSSTVWTNDAWKNQDNEFAGLTMNFNNPTKIGKIRIKGLENNPYYLTYLVEVWVLKQKASGEMGEKYVRSSSSKEFEMSPALGNTIDISFTSAMVLGGVQLRLFRNTSPSAPAAYTISEVEFYPPSLSYGAPIVASTAHNDVYNVEKLVDGEPNGTSYYESAELPAQIVIDLKDIYTITTIVLHLPASYAWTARTQNIEFSGSDSNVDYSQQTQFSVIKPAANYLFDPALGNRVTIDLNPGVSLRFFKIVINSNDIAAGYNAQLSEVNLFGY